MSNHQITLDLETNSGGGNSKCTSASADLPSNTCSATDGPNDDDTPAIPGISVLTDPVDDNVEMMDHNSGKVRALDSEQQLEANLEQEVLMHRLAAAHFNALNNWIMVFPSIGLTLATGIISFAASGKEYAGMQKNAVLIGIFAVVSGFWQSLGKHFDFGRRHAQHDAVVVGLKKIKEDFAFKKLASGCVIDSDYCSRVNEHFTLATDEVESAVPGKISTTFSSIAAEINLHFVMAEKSDILPKTGLNREDLYLTAFVELYKVIAQYPLFPLMLPDPDASSSTAMAKLRNKLTSQSCA